MDLEELWNKAIIEHNNDEYHEAHELFEDLWMELDDRTEKDIVQTLAQADALAVHLQTGNIRAAQRLMRQLPELLQTFPSEYRHINLKKIKTWIQDMILNIPLSGDITKEEIRNSKPPKLTE
jgi:predicted metal-dependent hydrolase|tara:strand:+ start:5403 stop:5768 length:366 start_codon:yes stop_codon:yes gene_type:complete